MPERSIVFHTMVRDLCAVCARVSMRLSAQWQDGGVSLSCSVVARTI